MEGTDGDVFFNLHSSENDHGHTHANIGCTAFVVRLIEARLHLRSLVTSPTAQMFGTVVRLYSSTCKHTATSTRMIRLSIAQQWMHWERAAVARCLAAGPT